MAKIIEFDKKQIEGDPRNRILFELYEIATEAVNVFVDRGELHADLELIHTEIEEILLSEGLASWEPEEDVDELDEYAELDDLE